MIPAPTEPPPQDSSLLPIRRSGRDRLRREDSLQSPNDSGWGWLANDIATNRARRAEAEAKNREAEEGTEDEEAAISDEARAALAGTTNADPFARSAMIEFRDPARRPENASRDPQSREREGDELESEDRRDLAKFENLGTDAVDEAAQPRDRWSPLLVDQAPSFGFRVDTPRYDAGLSSLSTPLESIRREAAQREPERKADPLRSFEFPFSAREGVSAISSDSPFSALRGAGGSPMVSDSHSSPWRGASFTPFQLAPTDLAPTPAPVFSATISQPFSTPATPPSPASSLGGMDRDHERAVPRALPW
ncbi:MAG: hypothetical protein NZ740_08130 [Kiritimatiellae bacterium]|nr:hypothetical protein [Kiritimatiellia bacterium]MDW8459061.1 hypothetical protein [Verrucomicrobiota bacterium]